MNKKPKNTAYHRLKKFVKKIPRKKKKQLKKQILEHWGYSPEEVGDMINFTQTIK